MIKDFKGENMDARLLIRRRLFGLGFRINLVNTFHIRKVVFSIEVDIVFLRFWIFIYKKH